MTKLEAPPHCCTCSVKHDQPCLHWPGLSKSHSCMTGMKCTQSIMTETSRAESHLDAVLMWARLAGPWLTSSGTALTW